MRIQYSPLIDAQVQLGEPSMNFDGVVVLPGTVKGKRATMSMSLDEALQLMRNLQGLGLEDMAKALGRAK